MRLALLLIALLAGNLFGQIDVNVVKYQQVTGLKNPVIIGSAIFVESLDATIVSKPVAVIAAKSQTGCEIVVEATNQQRESVTLEKIDSGYLLTSPGKTWVEVKEYAEIEIRGVPRKFLVDSKEILVELGPPIPPPPPPGSCDQKTNTNFNNLAKRSCEWVSIVGAFSSKRGELSKVYLGASEMLASGKLLTIDASSAFVKTEWNRVLTDPQAKTAWGEWSTKVNEELSVHWNNQTTNTAKRELMVQFYRSLSEGLAN